MKICIDCNQEHNFRLKRCENCYNLKYKRTCQICDNEYYTNKYNIINKRKSIVKDINCADCVNLRRYKGNCVVCEIEGVMTKDYPFCQNECYKYFTLMDTDTNIESNKIAKLKILETLHVNYQGKYETSREEILTLYLPVYEPKYNNDEDYKSYLEDNLENFQDLSEDDYNTFYGSSYTREILNIKIYEKN